MDAQGVTVLVAVLLFVIDLLVKIAALIILPRDRKPTAAMAWLLAIFFIPYLGIFFFLLIGSAKLPKKRRDKQKDIDRLIADSAVGHGLPVDRERWPAWLAGVAELNHTLGSMAMVGGNRAELIGDYPASIAGMAADIDTATSFVHVEFYIVSFNDATREFFAAMERAVKRGVTVRVLLDHVASVRAVGHKETFAELDRIGVKWSFMLPVQPLKGKYQRPDLRNHRKLVVVDGRVGWMGSQNLTDRSYNAPKNIKRGLQWQELMTRVTGPIVTGINVIFLGDWWCETDEMITDENVPITEVTPDTSPDALDCQVVPSGPGYDGENNLRLFLELIHSAQDKAIITSPFVDSMREVEAGYRAIGSQITLEAWEREPRSATFLDGLARLTSALQ